MSKQNKQKEKKHIIENHILAESFNTTGANIPKIKNLESELESKNKKNH